MLHTILINITQCSLRATASQFHNNAKRCTNSQMQRSCFLLKQKSLTDSKWLATGANFNIYFINYSICDAFMPSTYNNLMMHNKYTI